jgi:hypothetical protein
LRPTNPIQSAHICGANANDIATTAAVVLAAVSTARPIATEYVPERSDSRTRLGDDLSGPRGRMSKGDDDQCREDPLHVPEKCVSEERTDDRDLDTDDRQ